MMHKIGMRAGLPILELEPVLKAKVWGGRAMEDTLRKPLPAEGLFGESWEVSDLDEGQSTVRTGTLRGRTLAELREQSGEDLLGGAPLVEGRFPLLVKIIDAKEALSVQVHPDEAACARLGGGARPKTEAWYIIDRQPGAVLHVGLQPGVHRRRFAKAAADGSVAALLRSVAVEPGDFVFLPAGTVHAIGGGILLAEVQQPSDTTFRVFDWNRAGTGGLPRALQVPAALESIDFGGSAGSAVERPASGRPGIVCRAFEMEEVRLGHGQAADLSGRGPLAVMIVRGEEAALWAGSEETRIPLGETRLVPACLAADVRLAASPDRPLVALAIRPPGG